MSRIKNFGSFLGGVGTAVAASIGAYSLFYPGKLAIESPPDLIESVGSLSSALDGLSLALTEDESEALKQRLQSLETQIARTITTGDNDQLPFVPRSFQGLRTFEQNVAYDFIAPNGVSRLLVFEDTNSGSAMFVQVDGAPAEVNAWPTIGQHIDIEFGNESCRFEFIDLERGSSITSRVNCS
ncbi:hypothetical protein TM1040_1309 [Ruegeria sp. TM1040]|uniref:hypothetical protein n=1 Tax=Ruegeria sp. (strain TM1040) TaxID=292414 RepID=UPI000055479C|nr:hypothetical protein [Ruegeria sp. TM1040]ABF64042.1 hypothetical protein TM1040_1309 [Ruegeria sp. TM1040]